MEGNISDSLLRQGLHVRSPALAEHLNTASMNAVVGTVNGIDLVSVAVNIVIIATIALLTSFAARIVDRMLKSYIPKVTGKVEVEVDETIQVMIRRLVSAAIYVLGLILIILQIPQLHSLATAMLAGAGIAGLAIGYAAKDSLSNFTAGIFIAIFQPFRVGDYVDFRGEFGQVEDLTLRHTVIRTWDNRRIIVPNNVMSTEPIVNWSIKEPEVAWTVDFDLAKASDIDRAREIILQEARSHPLVFKNREIKVLLTSSRYSEQNLKLFIHVPGREVAQGIGCEIREAVKKGFEREGIAPGSKDGAG
jgi:small-conductance mechanosensitive channel